MVINWLTNLEGGTSSLGAVPGIFAIVQHFEEFVHITDIEVHGCQPDLHLVVFQDAFELLQWAPNQLEPLGHN